MGRKIKILFFKISGNGSRALRECPSGLAPERAFRKGRVLRSPRSGQGERDREARLPFCRKERSGLRQNVLRLCDGRQRMNLIINRELSGGYCKTAVSRWPFSQNK